MVKLPSKAKNTVKKILKPIYYSYAGYTLYDLSQKLTGYKRERNRLYAGIGYYPNLKNPQSFNEKVLWKKIYDRNPVLPIISDKLRVRDYLKEFLGQEEAEKLLIPLLHVTDRPEEIPFDNIPEEYIIKPNHASGICILSENIEKRRRYTILDGFRTSVLYDSNHARSKIIDVCKDWLSTPYGFHAHEWAYQKIKRKIVIEKLLRDRTGKFPDDYKFTVIHGKCYLIGVIYDRFVNKKKVRYTPDWECLKSSKNINQSDYRKKPENLESMIELSELLGKPFDFIRVDLYLFNNQVFFAFVWGIEITSRGLIPT